MAGVAISWRTKTYPDAPGSGAVGCAGPASQRLRGLCAVPPSRPMGASPARAFLRVDARPLLAKLRHVAPPPFAAQDAAAARAGLRRAENDFVAFRQRPACRHGEPQSQQQPLATLLGPVFELRAAVIHQVVVEQLNVARLEMHVERELVRELAVEVSASVCCGV